MKVLCNITWRCTLGDCVYCWIFGRNGVGSGFVERQSLEELSTKQWIEGLNRLPSCTIDFCGGEPTILGEGFVQIVSALPRQKYRWALTTNLATDEGMTTLKRAIALGFPSFAGVSCSYHHGVPINDFVRRYEELLRMVKEPMVGINLVISPFHDYSKEIDLFVLRRYHLKKAPYQNPRDSNRQLGNLWSCDAGKNHIVISPNGEIYRCLTAFRSDRRNEYYMGHLLGGLGIDDGMEDCDLNCDSVEAWCWKITRAMRRKEEVA